ncbi:MAG: hypothetical protein ACE15C_17155 [Phycisphaerae bacterium]
MSRSSRRRGRLAFIIGGLIAMAVALAGCKSTEKEISEAAHLLAQQHAAWNAALEGCKKGQPDIGQIRTVGEYLYERTRRRVEIDYAGQNKQEVIALLKALGQAYSDTVMAKTVPTATSYALAPGATNQDICQAFLALDPKYQKLIEMTK